jgi:hypothetical protein
MPESSRIVTGPFGTATEIDMATTTPGTPAQQASLACWFLHIPGAHPLWSRFLLSAVHLREVDGAPPAFKRFAGATHEMLVIALDPALEPRPDDVTTWRHLTPVNVVEQFAVNTDEDAIAITEALARACVDGLLLVEPEGILGAREQWTQTVSSTSEHLRLGGHPLAPEKEQVH